MTTLVPQPQPAASQLGPQKTSVQFQRPAEKLTNLRTTVEERPFRAAYARWRKSQDMPQDEIEARSVHCQGYRQFGFDALLGLINAGFSA